MNTNPIESNNYWGAKVGILMLNRKFGCQNAFLPQFMSSILIRRHFNFYPKCLFD